MTHIIKQWMEFQPHLIFFWTYFNESKSFTCNWYQGLYNNLTELQILNFNSLLSNHNFPCLTFCLSLSKVRYQGREGERERGQWLCVSCPSSPSWLISPGGMPPLREHARIKINNRSFTSSITHTHTNRTHIDPCTHEVLILHRRDRISEIWNSVPVPKNLLHLL